MVMGQITSRYDKNSKIFHGPYTKIETVNILCEKLATSAYTMPPPTDTNPPHMHAAKIFITIDAQKNTHPHG